MRICIATTKRPIKADEFIKCLHRNAPKFNVRVTAVLGRLGSSCYNIGLEIEGLHDDVVDYVNALTLALFPARWTKTEDEFEGFVLEDLG